MRKRTGDRDARETLSSLYIKDVFDSMMRSQHNWRGDKAVLVTLDGSNHCRLGRNRLVVVNDSDSSQKLTKGVVRVFHRR